MAKEKYGEAFISGIKRNMQAQGITTPLKPAKPIGYLSKETLRRVPGEIIPSTKKVLKAVGRGVLAPARAIGGLFKKKPKGKKLLGK
jgi:hypothetical protein